MGTCAGAVVAVEPVLGWGGAQSKGLGSMGVVTLRACGCGGRSQVRVQSAAPPGFQAGCRSQALMLRLPHVAPAEGPPPPPAHPQLVGLLAQSEAGGAGDGVGEAVGVDQPRGVLVAQGRLHRQLVRVAHSRAGGARHQAAQAHAAVQAVLEAADKWGGRKHKGIGTGKRTGAALDLMHNSTRDAIEPHPWLGQDASGPCTRSAFMPYWTQGRLQEGGVGGDHERHHEGGI
jgi:hypothetical protein